MCILKSEKDGNHYVGYSNDLKQRLAIHNVRKVQSPKNRLHMQPIYFEVCLNQFSVSKSTP